jgi:tetratricopeptide (TPR) repeat protein
VADRYRITRLIGRGGMGEVYEAHDLLLDEQVALKTLRGDLAGDEALLMRFQQEISIARKVTHPNVCRIFEVGIHRVASQPPMLFFAMELLHGQTLADRIRAGRLTRDEAFPIAVQLAEGLGAAHKAGIVHADFKSANVILVPAGTGLRAVITDFGVARAEPGNTVVDETRSGNETIRIAGTLAYMSPEQLSGDRVTTASDIYSFGIVLFEMACGQRPFDDSDVIKSAMLRASGPPASARSFVPSLDERWNTAITRCLQRDPRQRFHSAAELASWLRDARWWDIGHWTLSDRIRASFAVVLLLTVALGAWTWVHRPYRPSPEAIRWYDRGVNALYSMTYETARKALEQAVRVDPSFALAHASLARAYDELDYTDRAKDSMLRAVAAAQDFRMTDADDRKLRALQFMVSRDYERAAPLVTQIEAEAASADRAAAAIESGWLAQQMERSDAAVAAFERALSLDGANAAAMLRLGYLFGRRGGQNDLQLALRAFDAAEQRYASAGDYEGVTQTRLERANLFVRRSRQREALPEIEKASSVAHTVGNRYQEVRLLLLQSTALRDLNQSARAIELARRAIDIAAAENMDNLATNGQIDLGNIYLRLGEYDTAEPIFVRAVDMAGRSRVRRIEARARMALGSLYEQNRRPELAKPLIEAGLLFYNQAGYRRDSLQAATVLGGLLRQLGDLDASIRVLRETVPGAVQLQDRRLEAQLHERIADNLRDRGDWPSAVAEYQQARTLQPSPIQAEYLRVAAAGLQWRLGRRDEAIGALDKAAALETPTTKLSHLVALERGEMAYADGRIQDVLTLTRTARPDLDEELARQFTLLRARALIRTGQVKEGTSMATAVVDHVSAARLSYEAARAQLALAEAFVAAGEGQRALSAARTALAYFEPRQVAEAIFRGHIYAANASGDGAEAARHFAAASTVLAQLRTTWTAPAVDRYLARPDITSLAHDTN